MGVGVAHFDVDNGSDKVFPSATVAIASRYPFDKDFSFQTELRGNFTLTDEDSDVFCNEAGSCSAEFESAFFVDIAINLGVTMTF